MRVRARDKVRMRERERERERERRETKIEKTETHRTNMTHGVCACVRAWGESISFPITLAEK